MSKSLLVLELYKAEGIECVCVERPSGTLIWMMMISLSIKLKNHDDIHHHRADKEAQMRHNLAKGRSLMTSANWVTDSPSRIFHEAQL